MNQDTIAAIATAISPAGIGIIRISGKDALKIIDKIFDFKAKDKKISDISTHTLHYGYIIDKKNNFIIDEVLVSFMLAPKSYTKENIVEINGHGGIIVLQKILQLVLENGARLAEPGEFTKRAFLNGRIDLSQAEAVIDLIQAKTELSLNSSVNQLKGSLSNKLELIKGKTLEIIAHIEASIDYPEYDIEELLYDNLLSQIQEIQENTKGLLDSYDDGKIIKEGIKTAIIGRPNVGKSSLLNALLQENRAIVTEVAGTTRDVLEEYMNIHGVPLRLIDTAGIRATEDLVEKIGVEKSKEKIEQADLILFIVDTSESLTQEDAYIYELIKDKNKIVLLNKTDLEKKDFIQEMLDKFQDEPTILISAKETKGLDDLEEKIKEMFMIGQIQLGDQVYITNVRHKNALEKAIDALDHVIFAISSKIEVDLIAIDLKNVYEAIGEITGDSIGEDLITQIFSQFCLGK